MVTGLAARWRCHICRRDWPLGVNSTTTRKKLAAKVGLFWAAGSTKNINTLHPEIRTCCLKKKKIPVIYYLLFIPEQCDESVISCQLSGLSLPSIRSSSKTCRSCVSFPCWRGQKQPFKHRHLMSGFICCAADPHGHIMCYCSIHINTKRLQYTQGILLLFFFMVDLSQRIKVYDWLSDATK